MNLSSVSLPSTLKTIGSSAFAGCSNLSSVAGGSNVTDIASNSFYGTGLTAAFLPSKLTCIESGAFSNCSKLVSAFICPNIRYLGDRLFYNCQNLADATIFAPDGDAYACYKTIPKDEFPGVYLKEWDPDFLMAEIDEANEYLQDVINELSNGDVL